MGFLPAAISLEALAAAFFYPATRWKPLPRTCAFLLVLAVILLFPLCLSHRPPLGRMMDTAICVGLAVKVYDLNAAAARGQAVSFFRYLVNLLNFAWIVLRRVPSEARLTARENLRRLLVNAAVFACGILLARGFFRTGWTARPFWLEHACKAVAFYLLIMGGANGIVALMRIAGMTALDPFHNPVSAATPSEFWRRWNRPAAQFFHEYIFLPFGGPRRPLTAALATFAASALIHEYLVWMVIGRIQGFQAAFFMTQGVAAVLTMRLRPTGWRAVAGRSLTFLFALTSGVLFLASLNHVVPFYSRPLPGWLGIWDRATAPA